MPTTATHARTLLFVPANRPDRYASALGSGADAIILDLEDAVAPPERETARDALHQAWFSLSRQAHERLVLRINAVATQWHARDVEFAVELMGSGLRAIMLPKAESGADIAALAAACPGAAILPMLESAAGFAALAEIAAAPQVARLTLGHWNLQAELGLQCGEDEAELGPARWEVVCASRRAGLGRPADGVSLATRDVQAIARDARRSRRWGFGGKLCIHPAQVPAVHQAFSPTRDEREWAARILHAASESAGGALQVDGQMVGASVIALARQIVEHVEDNTP